MTCGLFSALIGEKTLRRDRLAGVSVAKQAIMTGVPEPSDLHAVVHNGLTAVMAGSRVLATYDNDDL